MEVFGVGYESKILSEEEIRHIVASAAEGLAAEGKSVLVIVPDHTRTCPLPQVARLLHAELSGCVEKLDFLIALGTHPPLAEEKIDRLLGVEPGRRAEVFGDSRFFNHRWNDPDALRKIGTITADQIRQIIAPELHNYAVDIDVTINKLVLEYDVVLIVGPVFPHEVVGFSGGSKYFFPGVCGEQLLNFLHWLGALITNPKIIGTKDTPVRATLEAAVEMLGINARALCMVVKGTELCGLFFGPVRQAWSDAVELSDKVHIVYVDRPFASVLSRAPKMYDDIWTGGKCMYKLEPVVADGGELIIYAPHINEISSTHGELIRKIGYHTRDYFLADWEKFQGYPWGVLAHSTHVRGVGRMEGGVEKPRINVTLATNIPEKLCRQIHLGYRNPASIDVASWQGRQDRLYVPKAGEMLYKLKNPPDWQRFDG